MNAEAVANSVIYPTTARASHYIPDGGLFSAYASTNINASPETVYRAILKVGDYNKWNTFVRDVTITQNPNPHQRRDGSTNDKRMSSDTRMIFHVAMSGDPSSLTSSREVCTAAQPLKLAKDGHQAPCITRVRWSLDNAAISTPGFLLRSERTNEIEEASDGTTIYRTWQSFSGPIARIVRYKFEDVLKERLSDWCRDLKQWCEQVGAQGTGDVKGGESAA